MPKLGEGWGYRYEKFQRVAQAWAIVGVAAAVRRSNGRIAEAKHRVDQHGVDPAAGDGDRAGTGRRRPSAIGQAADHAADGTRHRLAT